MSPYQAFLDKITASVRTVSNETRLFHTPTMPTILDDTIISQSAIQVHCCVTLVPSIMGHYDSPNVTNALCNHINIIFQQDDSTHFSNEL